MLKLLQEFVGCNYKDLQLNQIFYTVVTQTPGFDFVCRVSVERVRNGGEIVTAVNGLGTVKNRGEIVTAVNSLSLSPPRSI